MELPNLLSLRIEFTNADSIRADFAAGGLIRASGPKQLSRDLTDLASIEAIGRR
jgi:hypothetical protein